MTFPEPAVDARDVLHLQQPDPETRDGPVVKVVYALTRDPNLQTRHLIVYNTGPVVGVDLPTLRRVFETYGTVERLESPNPSCARVHVSFDKVESAVRARAERNRPPEVEQRVRAGVPRAAQASDVFAPKPGEPCPLLGRWLKVSFAEIRLRDANGVAGRKEIANATTKHLAKPDYLKNFKALDALAEGGTIATDTRRTPCPLCARPCGGQRGLRMHLIDAHQTELPDRERLVELLKQGNSFLPPASRCPLGASDEVRDGGKGDAANPSSQPPSRGSSRCVGAGAAAKGRAGEKLSLGFVAARDGLLEDLRRLVGGVGVAPWDPKTAVDKNGSSPLDWAAGEGRLAVCRYLVLECGVDQGKACTSKGRGEGRTALHWAARGGHEEVCRFLLDTPCPETDVYEGGRGSRETKNGFGERFIDPDVSAAEGTTPLHWACWGGHLETCQLLVSRGADHRKVNAHGCNVAHWCGLAGDVSVCSWLASPEEGGAGGLDWGKTNLQGHTICHKAALKGNKDLLGWLWRQTIAGVVPRSAWSEDESGYVPKDIARLSGHVDVADWLETEARLDNKE